MREFYNKNGDVCIYDLGDSGMDIDISVIEYCPKLFKDLRQKHGISDNFMYQSFAPLHNIQAIHNFFTGSGKSSSFFFFSDNKSFVLKTLKDTEKKLLLDQGVFFSYYQYMMSNQESLLSKYFGVYTIRIQHMSDITCFIMDNLLGRDFMNIERIYDLKGSTLGRRVQLTK